MRVLRIIGNLVVWLVAFCALGTFVGFGLAVFLEPWAQRQALLIMGLDAATEADPLRTGVVGPALATMIVAGPAVACAAYCASKLTPRLAGWRVALPFVPMLAAATLPWWYADRLADASLGRDAWSATQVAGARLLAVAILASLPTALLTAYLGHLTAPDLLRPKERSDAEEE